MNIKIAILAIIEIISSLSIGVLILFFTYKILEYVGTKKYGIEKNNLAYSIFMASVLFAVGYMVSSVIQPIISSFRILSNTTEGTGALIMTFMAYGSLYVVIAFISGISVSFIGATFYTYLTPLDEFKEIKNNNVGVAIIVSIIIVTLVLMSKSGITLLIESIIPYPDLPPR
jgi:uncharacterized membrane protein YjfL (UPF0719 family)